MTDALWPDFGREQFREALEEFARRERRFGSVRQADGTTRARSAGAPAPSGSQD